MPGSGEWRQKVCVLPLCAQSEHSGPSTAPRDLGIRPGLVGGSLQAHTACPKRQRAELPPCPWGQGQRGGGWHRASPWAAPRDRTGCPARCPQATRVCPAGRPYAVRPAGSCSHPQPARLIFFPGITRILTELLLCTFTWGTGAFALLIK